MGKDITVASCGGVRRWWGTMGREEGISERKVRNKGKEGGFAIYI